MQPTLPVFLLSLLYSTWAVASQVRDAQGGNETITTDVAIIGGGASGTYAAIRLQQQGYSVALVEKEPRLGGQVNTYRDPKTNRTVDFGVLVFQNTTVVLDYFSYLNVSLGPLDGSSSTTTSYANFSGDGKTVNISSDSVIWGNESTVNAALASYADLLADYPYLWNGFDLPDPVPKDLVLTWGEFLEKYNLDALAYYALNLIEGFGIILDQPAIYVMKWFGQLQVDSLRGNGVEPLTTTNNDNQELYNAALAKLGTQAFTNSNVTKIERDSNNEVQVSISTLSGPKLVIAKKLLVSIPPTISNLNELGMTLSTKEQTLFTQFNNSYYWTMIIENSGIPDDVKLTNVDLSLPLGIPSLPGVYGFEPSGLPGLQDALYGSPYYISDEQVKADTLSILAKLVSANGYSNSSNSSAEIIAFANHSPCELRVSTEAIQNGFYGNLSSIQGQNNTWWTGAAFQTQNSAQIWNWTEYTLLPQIVASL